MNNDPVSDTPQGEPVVTLAAAQAAERAEAAATRRRWISLAELVGVAGLIIAALSLWMSWSDRRADLAEKQAEQVSRNKVQTLVTIAGSVSDDGASITLSDPAHPLHDVEVTFPAELGVRPQTGLLGPKIEADWFAEPLLGLSEHVNQGRLPVILAATYWDGDTKRTDRALYDVIWVASSRLIGGRKLRIRGLMLSDREASRSRLEAAWARLKPASKS